MKIQGDYPTPDTDTPAWDPMVWPRWPAGGGRPGDLYGYEHPDGLRRYLIVRKDHAVPISISDWQAYLDGR